MKQKYNYWYWRNFISKENIKKINECEPVYHVRDKPAQNVIKTSKVKFLFH